MSHELKEGVKLKVVEGSGYYASLGESSNQSLHERYCSSITVVMQLGEQSLVPWAKVIRNSGDVELVNLRLMESVILLEPEEGEEVLS